MSLTLLGVTGAASGGALPSPRINIDTPAGTQSADILIDYDLIDDESDPCDITVEFSDDGGGSWNPATEGAGGDGTTGLSASPDPGEAHVFSWDSVADGVAAGGADNDVRIRVTPDDGSTTGPAASTGNFTVNNAGDDMIFLEEQVVGVGGAASVTLDNSGAGLSQAYRHLELFWLGRASTNGAKNLRIQFNSDTGNNYSRLLLQGFDTTAQATEENAVASGLIGSLTGLDGLANAVGSGKIILPYYSGTVFFKNAHALGGRVDSTTSTTSDVPRVTWQNVAAITKIVLFPSANNFIEGSRFSLYGIL